MADLEVAGTSLRVRRDTYTETAGVIGGERMRAFDNTLLSTERNVKRVVECDVDFLSPTDYDAFTASVPRGEGVTIDGDLPRTAFTGACDVGPSTAIFRDQDDPLWTCKLHIEEV